MNNIQKFAKLGTKINGALTIFKKQSSAIESTLKEFNELLVTMKPNSSNPQEVVKNGRGRPKKQEKITVVITKNKPGRPKKIVEDTKKTIIISKNPVGRPKQADKVENKRLPGRPKKQEIVIAGKVNTKNQSVVTKLPPVAMREEIERIEQNSKKYNQWIDESTKTEIVAKIENGSYLGVIEGFNSSGNSGKYGITTRVYVNPNSKLVPSDLKNNINTAAVNRIRYVDSKEEGISYINRQKEKLKEDFFTEILPQIIKDHGKENSVYAFHLNNEVRKSFNKLKVAYNEIVSASTTSKPEKKKVSIG
jgi:hypothetical protein